MKVLNLYAGIGGNRKFWEAVEVTAVEMDPAIADIYQKHFPNDNVIVADAHQYLLDHYKEFHFIWSSPPCPTHSRINKNFNFVRYPDMKLWQEIILLNTWFEGKFCVENVIPYYGNQLGLVLAGLIPQQFNRHLFWCNFKIKTTSKRNPPKQINMIATKSKYAGKRLKNFTNKNGHKSIGEIFGLEKHDKTLNNAVHPDVGLMVLNSARGILTKKDQKQTHLFE